MEVAKKPHSFSYLDSVPGVFYSSFVAIFGTLTIHLTDKTP